MELEITLLLVIIMFDKTAIHRIFSLKRPKCRRIPRLFVFDCCSGSQEKDPELRNVNDDVDDEKDDHLIPKKSWNQ